MRRIALHNNEKTRHQNLLPDAAYWQSQPDAKKFEAAWQMVLDAYAIKGEDISELKTSKKLLEAFDEELESER